MKMIINSHDGIVAIVDDYTGPVPGQGEFIFYPPLNDDGTSDLSLHGTNVMSVKSVNYGIVTRPQHGEGHFVGRPVQIVEIWV